MSENTSERGIVRDIVNEARIAVLTYEDDAGRLASSPMGTVKVSDLAVVHLLTETDSDKAEAIRANPAVNVHYATDSGWVSVSGDATVQNDPTVLRELWNPGAEAWMPEGPDSPKAGYFRIEVDTAKYWDAPGKPARLVQFAKGLVSDERPDMGRQGVVDL